MVRTIIIEDEANARATLKKDLALHCPQLQLLGEADGVKTGIQMIREKEPDLVFLDINPTRCWLAWIKM